MQSQRLATVCFLIVLTLVAGWSCGLPDYTFQDFGADAGGRPATGGIAGAGGTPQAGTSSGGTAGSISTTGGASGSSGSAGAGAVSAGGIDGGPVSSGGTGAGGGQSATGGTVATQCSSDADCAATPATPACYTVSGSCVQCLPGQSTCGAGLYCSATFECEIGCASDLDCVGMSSTDAGSPALDAGAAEAGARDGGPREAGAPRCDSIQHVCVGCLADADCPTGSLCDTATGQCEPGCSPARLCPAGFTCCGSECANFLTSEAHCGGCDAPCDPAGGVGTCANGFCTFAGCQTGFGDCNNNLLDGCETALTTDPLHCGACGAPCVGFPNAAPACSGGRCALGACDFGFDDCEGNPTNGCETNTQVNASNCGGCAFVCDLLNASSACQGGSCAIASCLAGFSNCDNLASNGCEVSVLTNPQHCGGCGNACSSAGATASCSQGQCALGSCNPGRANCNGDPSDGCEVDTNADPVHCGACFQACSLPGAVAGCDRGTCIITDCDPGYEDCDGDPLNGCEAYLDTGTSNCGTCGAVCPANNGTPTCTLGACSIACTAGFEDCDAVQGNGCEVNTSANVDNCGTCDNVCQATGGTPVCNDGTCAVSSCVAPLGDCDNDIGTGCETNLTTSLDHCGGCGKPCFVANGTAGCGAGTCYVQSCSLGYADCNGLYQDGCEALLNTTTNCGQCGQTCGLPNASASCATGSCQVSSCNPPYADCDGSSANGCEINLDTNKNHCSACNAACDSTNGAAYCSSGLCQITCASGFGNCNLQMGDGCETTLTNNALACGACGNVCSAPNGTPACVGTSCAVGACNAGFDDCDLQVANGCETSIATNAQNCGQCGRVCSSVNGSSTCSGGACQIQCGPGFGNCDNNALNGCEVSTNTLTNCGGCGLVCSFANAGASCATGTCAMVACNSGFADCDGLASTGCETSLSSVTSCGSCANACTNDNGSTSCVSGQCAPQCVAGYADCNGNPNDGCETSLRTVTDCGACGVLCSRPGGVTSCATGVCQLDSCDNGYGNCDSIDSNGCETDTSSSTAHCGGCGSVCSSTNGTPTCTGGTCGVTCGAGFANCDFSVANGCETNTANNPANCSGCGLTCDFQNAGASCLGGTCQMGACLPGFADCDGLPANGCETDLNAVTDCGACGALCDLANAAESCVDGQCLPGACDPNFADCDGAPANGCEANVLGDPAHCGGCGATCAATNGTTACNAGVCEIVCDVGFGDCDLDGATGCEESLNTLTHCGSCNVACSNANGSTACTAGVCVPACLAGFDDCDGDAPNGCETDLEADATHCGACNQACTNGNGTTSCSAGLCVPACSGSFGDCDGSLSNGCETDLTTASNCGMCGQSCTNAHGNTACTGGACDPACSAGYDDCDGILKNGCETNINASVSNCGSCGYACPAGGGTPNCVGGSCGSTTCAAGLGDCDGDATCETDLTSTVTDCGGCGDVCLLDNATSTCTGGACAVLSCDPGYENCDGDPDTGCEVATDSDVGNCGGCAVACSTVNGTASCALGGCVIACASGFSDCDGDVATGCEENIKTSTLHCGACGNACSNPSGTTACSNGACVPSCAAGFADCDGIPSNGCETDVMTSPTSCGACGIACTNPNGTTSCSAGACAPVCDAGFDSCDGNARNGCETSTDTTSHCGACGTVCTNAQGTTSCVAGACTPVCLGSYESCDGDPNNGCETNKNTSVSHCGGCGQGCSAAGAVSSCVGAACSFTCNPGFANCDGQAGNGCEADLNTIGNCGGCGITCTNPNGTTSCPLGTCIPACTNGFGDCNGNPADGCERGINSVSDCGACNALCDLANASESCVSGACTLGTCTAGSGNCDGIATNGCETSTQTSLTHCGACGQPCTNAHGTTTCSSGVCLPACSAPWADCDGTAANGCETNTSTSATSCGACGTTCSFLNATATCSSGACQMGTCAAGFGDCSGGSADGCETNLATAASSCGACGNACTNANGTTACSAGVCVPSCSADYADCDGNPSNGCETSLRTAGNCGGCGTLCSRPNASEICVTGVCLIDTCDAGFGNCDGADGNGCEANTGTDPVNCGACAQACNGTNGTPSCSGGTCGITCSSGFGDCDGVAQNGCETNLNGDPLNCSACGSACSLPNAVESCFTGGCQVVGCDPGYGNCDASNGNGCETSLSTLASCGGCNVACDLANAAESCSSGSCALGTCSAGFGNCDGDASNGCETNTTSTVTHCGACNNACSSTNGNGTCSNGACSIACSGGFGNCDNDPSDGCEASLSTTATCGSCGNACSNANGATSCVSGACVPSCNSGFGDCNGNPSDGCETGLLSATASCGACGSACINANGTTSCSGGICQPVCAAGYADCDGNPQNGCERPITTPTDCGGCNVACTNPSGTTSCNSGVCAPVCASGYGSCDGNPSNGCETSTNSDINNCGTCTTVCPSGGGTPNCVLGVCGVSNCNPGLGDCDGASGNGCEVDLTSSLGNCGACGSTCNLANASEQCVSSTCGIASCNSGYGNCDTLASTGCEVQTDTSVNNCGTCGTVCSSTNGSATCSLGACAISCSAAHGDCDNDAGTGCETDTSTSTAHCGACGQACTNPNGTTSCTSGACQPVCNTNFASCDGDPKNGCEANLQTSTTHCGGCGLACTNAHGTTSCTSGACLPSCAAGYADCNGNPADGCETATAADAANCGACGIQCTNSNGTTSCSAGACVPVCGANYASCDGNPNNGCEVSTQTSLAHCGGCGQACGGANATGTCSLGACALTCSSGYGNCNAQNGDGCEASLSTTADCGSCGNSCTNANGTTSCSGGACIPVCSAGYKDCNGDVDDGCERSTTTLTDCGSCNVSCDLANASESCGAGSCALVTCLSGYGNCDNGPANGCEAPLSTSANCGSCGNACVNDNGTTSCNGTACVPVCNGGFGSCDGNPSNGCEANTTNSTANCGACGTVCDGTNGFASCSNSACSINCNANYGNCDGSFTNGCEADLLTNASDCGACNNGCTNAHGTTSCSGGACVPVCGSGYGSCDGNGQNGCETDTATSSSNCGACGTVCATTNASATSCSGGTCQPVCNSGYADCDGNPANGCETNTDTSTSHCGTCGNACSIGSCSLGACAYAFPYVPSNFDPANASLNPGATNAQTTFNCGTTIFNSTTGLFSGTCPGFVAPVPVVVSQFGGPDAVVLGFQDITVASGSTFKLEGNKPVILAVYGDATIQGTLSASSAGATPGAGGNVSCFFGQGGLGGSDNADAGGGGGGGGFGLGGAVGGRGHDGSSLAYGGVAGATEGNATLVPLRGGCAGGMAGTGQSDFAGGGGLGGAGGGAVQLSVTGTLQIGATGRVAASGGGGRVGADTHGGGGGGSGGAVLLEGDVVTVAPGAWITVNAGGGGGGDAGAPGNDGSSSSSARANGGLGVPDGGSGGPGGASSGAAGGGTVGLTDDGGGGGGGGLGRIRVNASMSCVLNGTSGALSASTCALCGDGVQNGAETGVDCGGASCAACAPSTCVDGIKGGTESDVDCGGSCADCGFGQFCGSSGDCTTGVCRGGVCVAPPTSVCTGDDHACAISDGGRVLCWGDDSSGEIGRREIVDYRRGPSYVASLSDAVQIACAEAGSHTCAVRAGGSVVCWGENGLYQLGDGFTTDRAQPITVPGISNAVQVSAGVQATCALLATGGVKCWGQGENGRLGTGNTADKTGPADVLAGATGPDLLTGAVAIASGEQHSCAILDAAHGARLVCWGAGGSGRLGDAAAVDRLSPVYVHGVGNAGTCNAADQSGCLDKIGAVSCAQDTTFVIHDAGLLSGWGNDYVGESGSGGASTFPKRVSGVGGVGTLDDAMWAGAGYNHSCAVRSSGQAVCWGEDDYGRLGDNDAAADYRVAPTAVVNGSGYAQVEPGTRFTCGLRQDGTTRCWGYNPQGQIADGTAIDRMTPTVPNGVRDVVEVDMGWDHACAVTSGGALYCWGDNYSGELGLGNQEEHYAPVQNTSISGASDVISLEWGTCVLLDSGQVKCWGHDGQGQNGDGQFSNPFDRYSPITVSGITDAIEIAGGENHICVIVDHAPVGDDITEVWCWGYNGYGQLGDNSNANRNLPVQVRGINNVGLLTDAVAIGAGWNHTCVTRSNGQAACWGLNAHAELGDASLTNRWTPVSVHGVGNVGLLGGLARGRRVIEGGAEHNCTLASNGRAFCWGAGGQGELGANLIATMQTPVQVVGNLDDFVRLSAQSDVSGHTCAVRTGGQVWCWGNNFYGELGDETRTQRNAPARVHLSEAATLFGNTDLSSPVVTVTTGLISSMAVHQNGKMSAWGAGGNGRLGNGFTTDDDLPNAACVDRVP